MAKKSFSGSHTKSSLKWMKEILEQWIEHNKRYQKFHHPSDSLFFYRERPSVGTLAAAAWSAPRGYAVQEYGSYKKDPSDKRKRKNGRDDLYIGRGYSYTLKLEAKFKWIRGDTQLNDEKFDSVYRKVMESATSDANKLVRDYEGDKLAGLVIFKFYVAREKWKNGMINDAIAMLENIDAEAKVWYFLDSEPIEDFVNHCFGTALFIQPVS